MMPEEQSHLGEVIGEVVTSLRNRVRSPLFSSIAISWPLINYRLLLVIFGGADFKSKIAYIDSDLYAGKYDSFYWHALVFPILAGVIYNLLFPWFDTQVSVGVLAWARWRQRKLFESEKKNIVAEEDQAQFFESWERKLNSINGQLVAANQNYQHLQTRSEAQLSAFKERLQAQVFGRVMAQCKSEDSSVQDFMNAFFSVIAGGATRGADFERIRILKRHPRLHVLLKVLVVAQSLDGRRADGTLVISRAVLQDNSGLVDADLDDLIEWMAAMRVIQQPDSVRQLAYMSGPETNFVRFRDVLSAM